MTSATALEADGAGRRIRVSRLPRDGEQIAFAADEAERRSLASFLGAIEIESLAVDLVAAPFGRGGVSLRGTLRGTIVQASVVTLEPVRQELREEVSLLFVPEGSRLAPRQAADEDGELHLDPEGDDLPDVFSGDTVDLDAALQETLALALDPYPRETGESFADRIESDPAADKVSPFAGLAALKGKGSDA